MKFTNLIVASVLCVGLQGWAQDESQNLERPPRSELQMGDLPDNAFTTFQGTTILHPFLPSSFALSDQLELKSSALGWFGSPNIGVEYALIKNTNMALSIEPSVSTVWARNGFEGAVILRYSQRTGAGFFNANLGASGGRYTLVSGLSVPFSLGYSVVASPHTIWDFRVASLNALTLLKGTFIGYGGFTWYHSFGSIFQLGLGLNALVGTLPAEWAPLLSILGIQPNLAIFPAPDVTLTFKF